MKMLHVLLGVVGILSFGSCRKAPVANLMPEAQSPVSAAATPEALATPSTYDTESAPGAATSSDVFLRGTASAQSANGLVTFPAGSRLQQVGPNTYTVQGHTLTLRDDQVTHDPALARGAQGSDKAVQAGSRSERGGLGSELAPMSPETALQLSTDPQYKALTERAAVVRSKIERVSRETSRVPNSDAKAAPNTPTLKGERQRLEQELQGITEQQNLLRMSK
jgi:hypothetical protein